MTTDPTPPTARECLHDVITMTDYCADCHAVFSPEAGWFHLRRADDIAYRVETEWHNGNLDDGTRDRILDGLPIPDLRLEPRVSEGLTVEALAKALWAVKDDPEWESVGAGWMHGGPTDRSVTYPAAALLANLPAPRPPEPDRTAALEAENERLRADLAVFTEEPGVLARVGAEHTTYWYNQTRLLDAKVAAMTDRTAALVERLRYASRTLHATDPEHTREWEDCGWGDCQKDRSAIALASLPEPAPVADGTVGR
jgi:hypothetical protein